MKAVWNGATVAESDDTLVVENNHYFPADSIHAEPKDADYDGRGAGEFAGRYAFWNGVIVEP